MKKIISFLLNLICCILTLTANSQEYMINGGFEQWSNVGVPSGTPYHYIDYALGWHTVHNSPDLAGSITGFGAGPGNVWAFPRNGSGCAHFGAPPNGSAEFFYGTTHPLSVGQTYNITFWVRKAEAQTMIAGKMGLVIAPTVPSIGLSPYSSSIQPQIIYAPKSAEYVPVKICYTAQTNGTHYLTFGPFENTGTPEEFSFFIDDVSITPVHQNDVYPIVNISSTQINFCNTDEIILDGSSSSNDSSYIWDLYQLENGNEELIFTSGILEGQANTLNVNDILTILQPGNCYRAYLTTQGVCRDKTSFDFCIVNPWVNFVYNGDPVCEGSLVDLTVTGDNGWTYTWTQGTTILSSGVGEQALQVTPTINNPIVQVQVSTPEGCTATLGYHFSVHSPNNIAPWMNGINGSGEYTAYVQQGDVLNFTSQLFNDNLGELVFSEVIEPLGNFPLFDIVEPSSTNNNLLSFSWDTGSSFIIPPVPIGTYDFSLSFIDNNVCGALGDNVTYTIIVICKNCPICVTYEDRGSNPPATPLPAETKAGKCIEAGFAQSVETGTTSVLFQAGVSIDLGPFFEAGTGFVAQIDPTTCVLDCETCCEDWEGFTIDEIPNGVYMNFEDSDPTNDIFQVTDINHPFCAFGAKGYELVITTETGSVITELDFSTVKCCPFESPAPENPIPHSSIWWNGYTTNIFGNEVHPNDGTYFYYLKLYGCIGETIEKQGFIHIFSDPGMIIAPTDVQAYTDEQLATISNEIETYKRLNNKIGLSPNPANECVTIIGVDEKNIQKAQLFDEKGHILEKELKLSNGTFNVAALSSGNYYCKIYINGVTITKKFVKL